MLHTTLCYLERGDQYLMLHRVKKKNDLNQGKWIGVGGKFQEGESPEECLLRECREEGELAWIRKADLYALPMWAGDRIFLDLLERDAPFFSLKLRYEGERLAEAALNGRPLETPFSMDEI